MKTLLLALVTLVACSCTGMDEQEKVIFGKALFGKRAQDKDAPKVIACAAEMLTMKKLESKGKVDTYEVSGSPVSAFGLMLGGGEIIRKGCDEFRKQLAGEMKKAKNKKDIEVQALFKFTHDTETQQVSRIKEKKKKRRI